MVEMFNSLFEKLDRDLVKRESTLRNLPSRLLSCAFPSVSSRIATLSSFSSNNTYESELEPCGSPNTIVTCIKWIQVVGIFLFFFPYLDIETVRPHTLVVSSTFLLRSLEVYKIRERRGGKKVTFALTSRAEKSGKKFSNEGCGDRAAWWLKFAMRKLWNHFAPRVLLKAQLVPGLSNFQCKIDMRRDTRQFLNEDSSVSNLYIYIYFRVIEPRFIIIPHFRIKF